jgi:hypothetical protein
MSAEATSSTAASATAQSQGDGRMTTYMERTVKSHRAAGWPRGESSKAAGATKPAVPKKVPTPKPVVPQKAPRRAKKKTT